MTYPLFSPAFAEPISISAGKFPASIQAFQKDLQTGLVDVDFQHQPRHQLLFVGGKLVNVYAFGDEIKRIDPEMWLESFNGSSPAASLRALALPTQAVRLPTSALKNNLSHGRIIHLRRWRISVGRVRMDWRCFRGKVVFRAIRFLWLPTKFYIPLAV
ncbi:MAG: hypothetical protein NT121_08355 [Chloroflexi bacterium]|nr:hypothetical protein [Chloroflexota bacterium]